MSVFHSAIHTVRRADGWANVCDGWPRARDPHSTKGEAEAAGRERAKEHKTEHIVHDADRTVEQRTSYMNLLEDAASPCDAAATAEAVTPADGCCRLVTVPSCSVDSVVEAVRRLGRRGAARHRSRTPRHISDRLVTAAMPLGRRSHGQGLRPQEGNGSRTHRGVREPLQTSTTHRECQKIVAAARFGNELDGFSAGGRGKSMVNAPDAVGATVGSKARDWKEPIGRLGLVGQGVVATIIGLLAIRIAIGDKDEAATSEGAVAWLAHQPLGKFLLVALTVALFALALWRFLCALMGDPVEGSEPKDRLKYAVLGVVYLLLAITTLGVTIANWTGSGDTAGSEESGDEGSQQAASTLFEWPAGRWLVGILGVAVIGYAGYNFH